MKTVVFFLAIAATLTMGLIGLALRSEAPAELSGAADSQRIRDPHISEFRSNMQSEEKMRKQVDGCETPSMNVISQRLNIFASILQKNEIPIDGISGVIVEVPSKTIEFKHGGQVSEACQKAGIIWYTPAAVNSSQRTWHQTGMGEPQTAYMWVAHTIRLGGDYDGPWNADIDKKTDEIRKSYIERTNGLFPVEDMTLGASGPYLKASVVIKLQPVDCGAWRYYEYDDANVIYVNGRYFIVNYEKTGT